VGREVLIRSLIAITAITAIAISAGCGGGDDPTRAELRLIAKADEICAGSQKAVKKANERSPEGEATLDVTYAETLVAISTSTVKRLAALKPPASVRAPYEKYVEAQQRSHRDYFTAAHATHAVHPGEYRAAMDRVDREQQRGYDFASEIGFDVCASSE
jgi:hypothetical protein